MCVAWREACMEEESFYVSQGLGFQVSSTHVGGERESISGLRFGLSSTHEKLLCLGQNM